MPTSTFTTDIPIKLADQIDAAAARLNRPHDWIIEQALQNWLYLEENHSPNDSGRSEGHK